MVEKQIRTRLSNKYDMASNWEKATFIPMKGEFIIYAKEDVNKNGEIYERFAQEQIKIGDGIHTVNELPFFNGAETLSGLTLDEIDEICSGTLTTFLDNIAVEEVSF